jgi:hypothetical protein
MGQFETSPHNIGVIFGNLQFLACNRKTCFFKIMTSFVRALFEKELARIVTWC